MCFTALEMKDTCFRIQKRICVFYPVKIVSSEWQRFFAIQSWEKWCENNGQNILVMF